MIYASLLITAGLILGAYGIETSVSECIISGTVLFILGAISGLVTETKLDDKVHKLEKELNEIKNTIKQEGEEK